MTPTNRQMEIIHESQINYMQVCAAHILLKSNSESVNVNEHLFCCITYEHSLPSSCIFL